MKNPTIDNKRSKVCNTCIEKSVYAPKGYFMQVGNLFIYKYSNINFLKVIVWLFQDKDNENIA